MLGWTPQPAVATQRKKQFPLNIGTCRNNGVRICTCNEFKSGEVFLASGLHIGERVLGEQLPSDRLAKNLPRHLHMLAHCRLGVHLSLQPLSPSRCLKRQYRANRDFASEKFHKKLASRCTIGL